MRKSLLAFSLAGLVASAACASAQAKGKPEDRPALMVPSPPARIIEPAEVVEPVADLPSAPSATGAPPASRSPRPAPPKPPTSEARPETKPGDPPATPVEPPPPATPPVRTPQTADPTVAKAVRTTIDTARGILNGVNYGPLSNVRKKAYNDAKLLLQQAEDALKEGNLAFAQGVASKAETLAKELAGR
jgi:hypothetical protein